MNSTTKDPAIYLDDPGLRFFKETGLRHLLYSLAIQSIEDLSAQRKRADAEKQSKSESRQVLDASANWLQTPSGHDCIAFLMPDVDVNVAVARIFRNPDAVLQALTAQHRQARTAMRAESGGDDSDFSVSGVNMERVTLELDAVEFLGCPSPSY